jgi:hypothetical protein
MSYLDKLVVRVVRSGTYGHHTAKICRWPLSQIQSNVGQEGWFECMVYLFHKYQPQSKSTQVSNLQYPLLLCILNLRRK